MSPAIIRLLDQLRAFVPAAHIRLQTFGLGGTAVDVSVGDRFFTLFCGPLSGNGVSEDKGDKPLFEAHDRYFDTPEEAADHFLQLVAEAASQLQPHAA